MVTIETQGLGIRYGSLEALRGVSLAFPRGSLTAIIGPSGCGKSSFLYALNRLTDLVPECKVQGSVRFEGQEILGRGVDLLSHRRRIGMIFQRPNPFPLSIRRNLELPLREHGVRARRELDVRVEEALRNVGLWDELRDRLDASALGLSGGQQQRLCLARALALLPEVLLMDEPCSALDPLSSTRVEDLIQGLRGRYTVIVVTHSLAQARRLSDRTALFWVQNGAGALIEEGPTPELFTDPREELTKAYVRGAQG